MKTLNFKKVPACFFSTKKACRYFFKIVSLGIGLLITADKNKKEQGWTSYYCR